MCNSICGIRYYVCMSLHSPYSYLFHHLPCPTQYQYIVLLFDFADVLTSFDISFYYYTLQHSRACFSCSIKEWREKKTLSNSLASNMLKPIICNVACFLAFMSPHIINILPLNDLSFHCLDKPVPISWPQRGDIVFENVSCRYGTQEKDIITNLSLKIPAGQRVSFNILCIKFKRTICRFH